MDVDRTRETAASVRKCFQHDLLLGSLTRESHLEGNPNMSWLLAALLATFVGAPADCMIVEFTSDNCGPCRQLQPALEKLKSEGWDIRTVNVQQEPALIKKYGVESLPTLLLISNGKEVDRIVGAAPYEKLLPRLAKLMLASNANSNANSLGSSNSKVDAPQILAPKLIDSTPNQLGRTTPAAAAENWQTSNGQASTGQTSQPNQRGSDSGITVRGQSPAGAFPMLAASANSMIASAPSSQAIAEKFEKLSSSASPSADSSGNAPSIQLASNLSSKGQAEPTFANSRQPDRLPTQPTRQLARNAAPIDLQQAIARAEAATVRIRVDEENTTAYGTGTVIDVHGDEALVLTCGHLFREMKRHSQLTIDLFAGRAQPMNIPAQLIDFKADAGDVDIGLISFKLPFAIEPVPLLPQSEALSVRQAAFSFGCDHGENPTRRDTQIKSINRYMGAPNIEIAGAPAVGRSGGGLFDNQGRLIGVCNAADAEGDEGIYAAADIVYAQIDRLQLSHLFNDNPAPQEQPIQLASGQALVRTPSIANPIPQQQAQGTTQSTALDGGVSQITCIVRDTNGREQIIRVDSPSPELLGAIYRQANGTSE